MIKNLFRLVNLLYTVSQKLDHLLAKFCFRLTRLIALWNADYKHIFIQKAYNKSRWLQNDEIELKFIFKNNHISSNTARQTCLLLTNCFWNYPVHKIFLVTVFEFRGVWNIIDTGGGQNKIKYSVQFIRGNYYNRLILDMRIAKTAAYFWDTVNTYSFTILVQSRRVEIPRLFTDGET